MHVQGQRPEPVRAPSRPLPARLRRLLLQAGLGSGLLPASGLDAMAAGAPATPPTFPRDHGAHPAQRTEWWYITGHCRVAAGSAAERSLGFQLTFFRSRVHGTEGMRSRFAARQLLFAHAAVTDLHGQRYWHDQRIAREGFALAQASEGDTDVRLGDWSLTRRDGAYVAQLPANGFGLELRFSPTQAVLLQGEAGLSRKGPEEKQHSRYYSLPQLAFEGTITLQGTRHAVRGEGAADANATFRPARGAAWLDHEWSDALMHPQAVGWDWIGINLYDGSALTAFQMRTRNGEALWDGGSFRHPALDGGRKPYVFARGEAQFKPLRFWKSTRTQASYPVEWLIRTPADNYILRALMEAQELDSRGSTGAIYWEGLSELLDGQRRPVGRGYLEMTGYAKPLVL